MNKPIHPAVAEHVMEENERLREALKFAFVTMSVTAKSERLAEVERRALLVEAARIDAALSQQAEPRYVTHRPLIRNAINLLGMRRPVAPDVQRVIDDLEAMLCGQSTPAGAPSEEWLQVATLAEPAPAQDEREAFEERWAVRGTDDEGNLGRKPLRSLVDQQRYLGDAVNGSWVWFQRGAAWQRSRPAQTEQLPVATWMGTDWNAQQQLIAQLCKLEPGTDLYAAPIAQTALSAVTAERDRLREAAELLSRLRGLINCTPENDIDKIPVWISTKHPTIERIDALLVAMAAKEA